jgi:WD40 repeat protein
VGKAGLWRPPDLQLALNWQTKHKPTLVWGQRYNPAFERTIVFLEYSKKEYDTEQRIKELEQKRKLHRARVTAIVLGSFAVVALLAFVYAIVQSSYATEKRKEAEIAQEEAQKNADRANVAETDAKKQAKDALVAKEAADKSAEAARLAQIAAEAAKAQAEVNLIKATEAETKAKAAQVAAEKDRAAAVASEKKALDAQKDAETRRYLSIAKGMALKSKELNDTTLQSLLAQQAFAFNKRYKGYIYDNDIYNGLYAALEKFNHPLTRSLEGHTKAARAIVSTTKSKSIYSGGSDGKIFKWTDQGGIWHPEKIAEFADPPPLINTNYHIYSMDVSPDGNWLAIGGLYPTDRDANYAMLLNLNNPTETPKKIPGYRSDIENVIFAPDGQGFFARSNSGRSIMYSDLTSSKEVITTKEKITAIDLNSDGSKLAGVDVDGNLYVWDVKRNYAPSVYPILKGSANDILSVVFSPLGNDIIIGDQKGEIRIVTAGQIRRVLSGHTSLIQELKFNHSGKFMASASYDKTIRIWNMENLKEQPTVLYSNDWVWSMAFSPDDEQIMGGIHSVTEGVRLTDTDFTIHAWPTKNTIMSTELCGRITRNMSKDEWDLYVAEDLQREKTCENLPPNNK